MRGGLKLKSGVDDGTIREAEGGVVLLLRRMLVGKRVFQTSVFWKQS
jgi:hypothetical protein